MLKACLWVMNKDKESMYMYSNEKSIADKRVRILTMWM